MRQGLIIGVLVAAAAAAWLVPSRAEACGGCFGPPPSPTDNVVVTGHRMAVAISARETTLWDQFQYAGNASDFAWILPIEGTAEVELADNAFFESLAQATQVTMVGTFPPLRTSCTDPCPSDGLFASADRGGAGGPASDGGTSGVTVYHEGVVGPYETATIGSEDPRALLDWLQDNGYTIPDETLPIIEHYVDLGLNFAALKLTPNAGVNQMQPVRVTTPGLMPVFPLRMISAGAADEVGLTLYVFAEGRYQGQNFPTVELDTRALRYDWDTGTFNYATVFDETLAEHDGRAWIAEYAKPAPTSFISGYVSYDEDGTIHTTTDDWAVVSRSIASPYLTVLRANMPVPHLDQDLILEAASGTDIENRIEVPRDVNRPPEPDCPVTCDSPAVGTGGAAVGVAGGPGTGVPAAGPEGLCSASVGSPASLAGVLSVLLGAGVLVARRRRR